jgi:hypothetical protein
MIAYEESGKLEILDPRIYNMLLKYKEKKCRKILIEMG